MTGFYELPKAERDFLVDTIQQNILKDLLQQQTTHLEKYFDDEDTYIRKAAYLSVGRIYFSQQKLKSAILNALKSLSIHESYKVRQSTINAAGEIGKKEFDVTQSFFDIGLFDKHHAPRNAVIGSIKKMAEVNPTPVLLWANQYLQHKDKEIRREICHGIELRGRKHPEDILPMLKILQHDTTARVRTTLIHVLGQIAYKKGCLAIVMADLKTWENKKLVQEAIAEIIDVHHRYRNFSALTQEEAIAYISAQSF
jgi:HEAT repeat protein